MCSLFLLVLFAHHHLLYRYYLPRPQHYTPLKLNSYGRTLFNASPISYNETHYLVVTGAYPAVGGWLSEIVYSVMDKDENHATLFTRPVTEVQFHVGDVRPFRARDGRICFTAVEISSLRVWFGYYPIFETRFVYSCDMSFDSVHIVERPYKNAIVWSLDEKLIYIDATDWAVFRGSEKLRTIRDCELGDWRGSSHAVRLEKYDVYAIAVHHKRATFDYDNAIVYVRADDEDGLPASCVGFQPLPSLSGKRPFAYVSGLEVVRNSSTTLMIMGGIGDTVPFLAYETVATL